MGSNEIVDRAKKAETRQTRRLGKLLMSPILFGVILFVFATTFPPFESATELDLAAHMLQHIVVTIAGVIISYSLYRRGKFDSIKGASVGISAFVTLAALIVLWHLPALWDAAVANYVVHIIEHICFFAVGFLIGFSIPMLPDNFRMLILVVAVSAHMFYGFALFLITTPIYPPSPVSQQSFLGILLFAPSPVYFVGYLYTSLTRESKRIEMEEYARSHGRAAPLTRKQSRFITRFTRNAMPIVSVLLVMLLIGYFGITSVALVGVTVRPSPQLSIVYIEETPFYWQFSPQNVRVVLGVNNTVVWVSHSYTVDTVTSGDGLFDSRTISSGGSWSYTFTSPGSYSYYCQYHPWMKGTVNVVPPT